MISHLTRLRPTVLFLAGVATIPGLWTGQNARAADPPLAVTAVRFWSMGDVTRVAIETSGDFVANPERLSNPPRVFFDIPGNLAIGRGKYYTVDVKDGVIKRIRLVQNKPRVTRVVIDLENRVEITSSQLSSPDRVIIEARSTAPKPAAKQIANSTPAAPPKRADGQGKRGNQTASPKESRAVAVAKPPKEAEEKPAQPELTIAQSEPGEVQVAVSMPAEPPVSPGVNRNKEAVPELHLAKPAQRTQRGDTSLTRALGLKMGRVVIDPGHGGRDTGTMAAGGVMEKDISLDVSARLKKLLEERMGFEVFLTREDDATVPLEDRTAFANEKRADLFLSIHVNSSRYQAVSGVETFYLNFTRSRADLEVATRENAGSNKSMHELSELVQKIALDDKIQESRDLASHVQLAVHRSASQQNPRARNRGVKKAPFVVLIGAQMPSVLVELGFLTNPAEQKLLKNPHHRQRIAESIVEGLQAYASTLSHFDLAKTNGVD